MAVEALKEIGRKLGKNDWDFSKDPCSGEGTWTANVVKGFESFVTCDCSFDHNTTCRIVRMYEIQLSFFPSPFTENIWLLLGSC